MKQKITMIMKNFFRNKRYHSLLKINNISQKEIHDSKIYIYFSSGIEQIYQINFWLNTLRELNKNYKIIIIVRSYKVYRYCKKEFPLNVMYFHYLNDLITFYEENPPKMIIYINNNYKNFQSLICQKAMHIYLNNEESNLFLGYSNQVKAYDYIFVSGLKRYNDYKKNISNLCNDQLINIGRPHLDLINPININKKSRKVILYAPTWESTSIVNNRYSSILDYGKTIVKNILDSDKYYLIYIPHPNVGKYDKKIKKENKKIINMIKKNKYAISMKNINLYNIYSSIDFAIFDLSYELIDYLSTDKPFCLVEGFDIKSVYEQELLEYSNILDIDNIDSCIEKEVNESENSNKLKSIYMENYNKGDSLKKFLDSINKIIDLRDFEVNSLKRYMDD